MSKKRVDKTPLKQQAWVERTAAVLGLSEAEARSLLDTPRRQSVRINTLLGDARATLEELRAVGWMGAQYDWCADGYSIDGDVIAVRDSMAAAEGRVFIQNAASWLPVLALDPRPGESILDVCAAPGGKTSHIAAVTANQAVITANDNSRPRLAKLRTNMERLGVQIERYTLFDATRLAQKLDGDRFDKILLDAPCSGEGLMRLSSSKDFNTWSVAHIKRLEVLQRRVILEAWQLLKPGGTLVYSTCTMAPEENEAVVDYLLRKHPDAVIEPITIALPNRVPAVRRWNGRDFAADLQGCLRLVPGERIEAFFVCKLKKLADKPADMI